MDFRAFCYIYLSASLVQLNIPIVDGEYDLTFRFLHFDTDYKDCDLWPGKQKCDTTFNTCINEICKTLDGPDNSHHFSFGRDKVQAFHLSDQHSLNLTIGVFDRDVGGSEHITDLSKILTKSDLSNQASVTIVIEGAHNTRIQISYSTACSEGYSGRDCNNCFPNPCKNNAVCKGFPNGFSCTRDTGKKFSRGLIKCSKSTKKPTIPTIDPGVAFFQGNVEQEIGNLTSKMEDVLRKSINNESVIVQVGIKTDMVTGENCETVTKVAYSITTNGNQISDSEVQKCFKQVTTSLHFQQYHGKIRLPKTKSKDNVFYSTMGGAVAVMVVFFAIVGIIERKQKKRSKAESGSTTSIDDGGTKKFLDEVV